MIAEGANILISEFFNYGLIDLGSVGLLQGGRRVVAKVEYLKGLTKVSIIRISDLIFQIYVCGCFQG